MDCHPERQHCHPERKRGIFSKVIVARLGYEYFTEDPSLALGMTLRWRSG